VTSGCKSWSLKHSEPSSLLAWVYTAALMRVTQGFLGVTGGMGFGGSGTGSRVSAEGADNGSVLTEGELLDSCCVNCQKVMLPIVMFWPGLAWL